MRLFNEVEARTKEVAETMEYQTATSEVLGVIKQITEQNLSNQSSTRSSMTAARLCAADYSALFSKER